MLLAVQPFGWSGLVCPVSGLLIIQLKLKKRSPENMGDRTGHAEDTAEKKTPDGKSGKAICRISTYMKRRASKRARKQWRGATSWSRTKGNGRV